MTAAERARSLCDTLMTGKPCRATCVIIEEAILGAEAEVREECAKIAERRFPRGGAHTYASENADRYIALEDAAEEIAAAIRAASRARCRPVRRVP